MFRSPVVERSMIRGPGRQGSSENRVPAYCMVGARGHRIAGAGDFNVIKVDEIKVWRDPWSTRGVGIGSS